MTVTVQAEWCPSDKRVRCINCRYHTDGGLYLDSYCGNEDGPQAMLRFLDPEEPKHTWCDEFQPVPILADQGVLPLPDHKAELIAALKAVIGNHCGLMTVFCSTCTPARSVIAKAEGRE